MERPAFKNENRISWPEILKDRASPQSRNAVLGFLALAGVLFSIALPDFLAFRSYYWTVDALRTERDELKGKRDRLFQRVIVRGNATEAQGLYWPRRVAPDGTELNSGQGYDTWRNKKPLERFIFEFASHATATEIVAYDRAVQHVNRLNREIGVYRTKADLGLPTIDVTVVKWGVPLVWLIALGIALWPVWELRETLKSAQRIARPDDGHDPPLLSFITVRREPNKLQIAPSALFRGLCLTMAALAFLACWMGYGYATAGFGPTGMSPLLQVLYQYTAIGIACFASAFLLRVAIWGPDPGGEGKEYRPVMWLPVSRRSLLASGLTVIAAVAIASGRQWRLTETVSPYLRVREKRRRVQIVIDMTPGFYFLARPWPNDISFARPTNYGRDRLVYLEDASDFRNQPGPVSVLHGYDWPSIESKLRSLDKPLDEATLAHLSKASGGTIRSYWIENATLDLVEAGELTAAANLLSIAIDMDMRERLAPARRVSVRLIHLYGYLASRDERMQQLADWVLTARDLDSKDLRMLKALQVRWKLGGLDTEQREAPWKLPRRAVEGGPTRVARSVQIG